MTCFVTKATPISYINQLLFNVLIVLVINDITGKSCEQGFITKEHIATYINLILLDLHSPLVIKILKVV